MDLALEVLKWVAIVFAAGVVAQLGKSLTLRILGARRGAGRPVSMANSTSAASAGDAGAPAPTKRELKLRKKELKAEAKRRKKGAPPAQG